MKVGDRVIALRALWSGDIGPKGIVPFSRGIIVERLKLGVFKDVQFDDGKKANGCTPGAHIELEAVYDSPLYQALL